MWLQESLFLVYASQGNSLVGQTKPGEKSQHWSTIQKFKPPAFNVDNQLRVWPRLMVLAAGMTQLQGQYFNAGHKLKSAVSTVSIYTGPDHSSLSECILSLLSGFRIHVVCHRVWKANIAKCYVTLGHVSHKFALLSLYFPKISGLQMLHVCFKQEEIVDKMVAQRLPPFPYKCILPVVNLEPLLKAIVWYSAMTNIPGAWNGLEQDLYRDK